MMLDKRQIWAIFLFKLKMNHKAAEKTRDINAFGPATVNKHAVQWWFKRFCKGDKSLEDEECSGLPLGIDNWEDHWSWFCLKIYDSLKTIWKVTEELHVDHSMVIWHLDQVGKVKKLDKWVPQELTENKKKSSFWNVIFSYNNKPFLNQIVTCGEKRWPAKWLDQQEAPKHFPRPNLYQKKGHGPCLVVCCLSDPLQLSESQQNHYIWEACSTEGIKNCKTCSWHWSTERAQFFSTTCLTTRHITNASKVGRIGLQNFASSAIFTQALAIQLPLLQTSWQLFAGKMLPQSAGGKKMLSKSSLNPKA